MAETAGNTEGAKKLGTNNGRERAAGTLSERIRRALRPSPLLERPDPATPEGARGLAPRPGGGSFVAPDCHRGTCSEHRGEHKEWPDCRDWTPLQPMPSYGEPRLSYALGDREGAVSGPRRNRLEAAAPPLESEQGEPGLLSCGHPANIANAQGGECAFCAAERLQPAGAGEAFIRLPSGEELPLERWAEEHPDGPLFETFRETLSGLQLVAIDRLAQLRSEPENAEAQRRLQRVMECEADRRRANLIGTPEEQAAAAEALLVALAERGERCSERLATSKELAAASGHPGWSAHRCCRLAPHSGEHLCTCGTAWRWSEGRADLEAALHRIRQLEPEQQRALLLDWFGPEGGRRLLAVIDSGPGAEEAFAPSSPARPL